MEPKGEKKKAGRPANGATTTLSVGIQPELKDRLAAYARRRRRSTSSLACIILTQWLDSHPEIPEGLDD
jgi:predicted transcriptional regulator